ncbi:MAG: polysaccharide deacetylase family protein [Acidimicrobiales bacterium]|nr:polysaccharide deacetylase family protein [Acidimicrobiales bacterium]|tara:strand:- start:856 stop:1704 length:849 start_codon:yes stop_codon:yes gene_type:complete
MTKNISVTLDVEDLRPSDQFEDRSKLMTEKVLDLFSEMNIRATIFVVGDVAKNHPEIINKAVKDGHEIGLHSHKHIPLQLLTPDEFEQELTGAKTLLQEISGQEINGFRAPTMSLTHKTRWAVPILKRVGFTYSSSVLPAKNPLYGWDGLPRHPFRWLNSVIEFPCPVTNILGFTIPYLGGAYFRLFPSIIRKMGVRRSSYGEVLWTYCHPWEFDPDEKYYQLENVGRSTSRIAWIGRKGMENKMRDFLKDASSQTLGDIASTMDSSQLEIVNAESPDNDKN